LKDVSKPEMVSIIASLPLLIIGSFAEFSKKFLRLPFFRARQQVFCSILCLLSLLIWADELTIENREKNLFIFLAI